MALHFDIKVNGDRIGAVVIIRRNRVVVPGEESTYTVEVEYPPGELHRTEITHDYDDGALVLLNKALSAIIEERG